MADSPPPAPERITDRWTQVQTLFERALDRPPDERTAWLRARCGGDPGLYREVEALLDGDARQNALFEGRAADFLPADDFAAAFTTSRLGERVGPWELGERVGEGGMGAVYRARRADGFEQTAALKLVKPGMDSEAVLARFRAERQILARLEHPGIARLLGGGLTTAERPYFAMEYVEGEPITAYCDGRRLGVEARLRLFAQACEAVRYAHRALVVHRDLKPSNVLVAEADGQPAVKLLDFGIARVLSDDAGAELTQTGQRVLTPGYAAPEQVRGEPPTTATDVYALGVLLYRLLCGARPVETEGRTPREIEAAVLGELPQRPSDRVTPAAAAARSETGAGLAKRLRGDLDTITLKALEKDPGRRYGSAAELLADLRRHLAELPIEARPASRAYRARLFVRRHRLGVAGTAGALALVGMVAAVAFARVSAERDRAEAEARRSEEVVGFLQNMLLGASPFEAPGEELTARELLDRGAEQVEADLADEPATRASLQILIGDVYLDLGRADDAVPLYRSALATRRAEGDEVGAANAARQLGRALRDLEQYDEAERLLRASLADLEALGGSPADVALTQRHLASLLRDQGDYETAEALYRQALATARSAPAPDGDLVADIQTSLVVLLRAQDRDGEAADIMAEVVAADRRLYPGDHPTPASSLALYSGLLSRAERHDEAIAAAREAARMFRAAHPDTTHPNVAAGVQAVAMALAAAGELAEADRLFGDAVARLRAAHGDADHRVLGVVLAHALLKEERGQPDAAAALFRRGAADAEALPTRQAVLLSYLADNRARQGDAAEAMRAFRRSAALLRADGDDARLDGVVTDFAAALREGRRDDLADEVLRERPAVE